MRGVIRQKCHLCAEKSIDKKININVEMVRVVVDVCVVIDTAGGVGSGDVVLVGLMHASSVQGGYIKK